MKTVCIALLAFLSVTFFACKKNKTAAPDVKNRFVGNWAGAQQYTGISTPYKFSLAINSDNTLVNIDSAFANQSYPGTYTYTADSLFINYANGTKWRMRFLADYTSCTGSMAGYSGATATVSMTKK